MLLYFKLWRSEEPKVKNWCSAISFLFSAQVVLLQEEVEILTSEFIQTKTKIIPPHILLCHLFKKQVVCYRIKSSEIKYLSTIHTKTISRSKKKKKSQLLESLGECKIRNHVGELQLHYSCHMYLIFVSNIKTTFNPPSQHPLGL